MFERPASGERAILVQLDFGDGDAAERLAEFDMLVEAPGPCRLPSSPAGGPVRPRVVCRQGQGR